MELRSIRPVMPGVAVDVEGTIEVIIGPAPETINKGDVIRFRASHKVAAGLGQLLTYTTQHSPAAALAEIQNDVDEIQLPPMG